jgi:hypothetical protein
MYIQDIIDLLSMVTSIYTVVGAILFKLFHREIRIDAPIFDFYSRLVARSAYLHLQSRREMNRYLWYIVLRTAMQMMFLLQIIIATAGYPWVGAILFCALCLPVWRLYNLTIIPRRRYWEKRPAEKFTIVSAKRFAWGVVIYKSLLIAAMIASLSLALILSTGNDWTTLVD